MPKASDEAVTFETSSGNVFADLGLKNAPEREAKAALMRMINGEIKHLQLTQKQAAERLGVGQPDVSRLSRGLGSTFSLERLITFLERLGLDIDISVRRGAGVMRVLEPA